MESSGPTVLITGASAGIGEALVWAYAQKGARIGLCARRLDRLESIVSQCQEAHPTAQFLTLVCDVVKPQDLEMAASRVVETWGNLDIAIANAGYGVAGRVERLKIDDYRNQFETNIFGVLNTFYGVLPHLKKQGFLCHCG